MKRMIHAAFLSMVMAAVTLGTTGCETLREEQVNRLHRAVNALMFPEESAETTESASEN